MPNTVKKYKITQLQDDDSLLELHPETDSDIVNYDNSNSTLSSTNAKAAIDELDAKIEDLDTGVTGVKGNAEQNYRTGNVNLTPANIGAQPKFTDGTATIASESNNVVTIKAGVKQTNGAIGNSTGSDIVLGTAAKKTATTSMSSTPSDSNVLTEKAVSTLLGGKVDNVQYDSTNKKITKTIAGTTSDVVSVATLKTDLALNNVTNDKQIKGLASGTTSGHIVTFGADGYTVADSGKAFSTATPSSSSTDTQIPTAKAVYNAIAALPTPMQFKGSVGTGGTVTDLPAAAASNNGWVYVVITDGTYGGLVCKEGDEVISNGTAWILIPSGDEPTGTVTSVGLTMPTGFSVANSPITSSGTLAVTFASGYSLPTTAKQNEWDAKVASVKVGNTAYNPTSGVVSLPAYPTELKNPNKLTINAAGQKVTDYDGSGVVALSIAASQTEGAFTVSDGTTTKTVQLALPAGDVYEVQANDITVTGQPTEIYGYPVTLSAKLISVIQSCRNPLYFSAALVSSLSGGSMTEAALFTNELIYDGLDDNYKMYAFSITVGGIVSSIESTTLLFSYNEQAQQYYLTLGNATIDGEYITGQISQINSDISNIQSDVGILQDQMPYKYEKPSGGIPSSDLASISGLDTTKAYSAYKVNAKGQVVAQGAMIEVGTTGQTTPSATLAVGGLFFQEI